jgi:hypothetical protein
MTLDQRACLLHPGDASTALLSAQHLSLPSCSNLTDSGFSEPTPIQRQAATALVAGRELLAIAPTGSGKTLAFLLPLVMRVRVLNKEAEAAAAEAAAADGSAEQEEGGEGERAGSGVKAVVVRCGMSCITVG